MTEFIVDLGYCPSVRIGNWYEELCLEEDEIQDFLEKRKKGDLALQKTRKLFSTFFKEVSLHYAKRISFGLRIQLIPTKMKICNLYQEYRPALSIVVHEKNINESQQINDRCELTIAPSIKPCVRNTFIIRSGDAKNREGENLHYGQDFILECVEAEERPLVLYSAPKSANLTNVISTSYRTMNNKGEENLPVGLCLLSKTGSEKGIPMAHCRWKCIHENPGMRFETEGTVVVSGTDLVIAHSTTNQFLAAENAKISTLFGPECLVSANSYLDVNKKQKWQNYWMIATSQK